MTATLAHATDAPLVALPGARPDLTLRPIGDELIVFDPRANATHRLNATAHDIWRLAAGAGSAREVARRLAERYAVDPAVAEVDVARTLRVLRELDLAHLDVSEERT